MRRLVTTVVLGLGLLAAGAGWWAGGERGQGGREAGGAGPGRWVEPGRVAKAEEAVVVEPEEAKGMAAVGRGKEAETAKDARSVIASGWRKAAAPELVNFREWAERYEAAGAGERAELAAEGVVRAEARRAVLAKLIAADPEAALAAAVPMAVRARLPAEVVARLETRVSGRGELALLAVTPVAGGPRPVEAMFRSALIGGVEYRAYVYGERARRDTVADTAMTGIALDRRMAVSESPVRLVEEGELLPPERAVVTGCASCAARAAATGGGGLAAGAVAYEYAGAFGVAESFGHFAADAARLETAERPESYAADNQPGSSTVSGRPALSWTHGTKKVLLIRVDFSDLPGAPRDFIAPGDTVEITETYAVSLINRAGGVAEFLNKSSFGKSTVSIAPATGGNSPDVTAVLRMPLPALAYALDGLNAQLHADARALASSAGVDLAAYDRIGVVFSRLSDFPGSEITYGGLANITGKNFWINGAYTFRVVAHELGHTYGLRHANLWKVTDGNAVSEAGSSEEYGDPFDIMGGGEFFSSLEDFSHWNKSILQWIPDTAVTVAETSGTYRVHRFDDPGANLGLPRALKVVRDPTRDYWIGYRRATAVGALDGGAYVLWGYNQSQQGDLLDLTTPGNNPDDSPLAVGATFDDAAAGVVLKPLAQGGSGADEWIDVQVTLRPRVQWTAEAVLADEQRGSVTLMLRRSANFSGALSVTYATEPGTATAGLDYTHVSGTVSWADGDMTEKTVTVPLVADALTEGAETFGVRLGAVTGGVRVGAAKATVTIADPGARDDTFATDFINSNVNRVLVLPDGKILAGGFFTLVQDAAAASFAYGRVARYQKNGAFDREFDPGAGADGTVHALAVQTDGNILVGGDFTTFAGAPAGRIVRLRPDGAVDASFDVGAGANGSVFDIVVQADGRILVGGAFSNFRGVSRNRLVRLEADGTVDTSFAPPGYDATAIRAIALQEDGKILAAGGFSFNGLPGDGFKSGVVRLNANGTRDASFDVGFGAHTNTATNVTTTVFDVAVQADGKVVVGGAFSDFGGTAGPTRSYVARMSASGAVESEFAPAPGPIAGTTRVSTVLPLADGTILIGGSFTTIDGGQSAGGIARLLANGEVDQVFRAAGGHGGTVQSVALQADGKAVFGGAVAQFQGSARSRAMWRLVPGLAEPAGVVEFVADAAVGFEGGSAVLTVRRTGGALGAARVGYATARNHSVDTATAGADYTAVSGVLAWADGDAEPKTITVPLAADAVADDGETFTVRIGEPVIGGVMLGERREMVVTISPTEAQPQAITFAGPGDVAFRTEPLQLVAAASSGLAVAFEVVSGPATVSGASLTLTGLGTVTVRATQAGSLAFLPAGAVERSFAVAQGVQTISFAEVPNRVAASGAFALTATSSAGLPLTFEVVSGPATVSGATLTPTGLGEVTVRATQAGNANVAAAVPVARSFMLTLAATVQITGTTQVYAGTPRAVGVTTNPAGLAVRVTYDGAETPPTAAGTYAVVAEVMDDEYTALGFSGLTVTKAPLTVRGGEVFKLLNAAVPVLAPTYEGFVGGDTAAVLDAVPTVTTTATARSKLGAYPITVTGGADANYEITRVAGVLNVVTLAGTYETLLREPETDAVIGLARVTIASDQKKFTSVLELAAETAKLAVAGTVSAPTGTPEAVSAAGTMRRAPKGVTPYVYTLEVEPFFDAFRATVRRDGVVIAAGEGTRLHAASAQTRGAFAGAFTLRLAGFGAEDAEDGRAVPVGDGFATATVARNGGLKLAGRLADGRALTGTLGAAAGRDGDYRWFARPYGARAESYVAGELLTSATRAARELEAAPTVWWRKSPKPATVKTEPYAAGFALTGAADLRRWVAPVKATRTVAAVTLDTRLALDAADAGALAVDYIGAPLGAAEGGLPLVAVLGPTGAVTASSAAAATKWNLRITPTSGLFTGSFVLTDAVPVAGKPDRIVRRTVAFRGVLRQPDGGVEATEPESDAGLLGVGNFVVPPLVTGGETLSGGIRIERLEGEG